MNDVISYDSAIRCLRETVWRLQTLQWQVCFYKCQDRFPSTKGNVFGAPARKSSCFALGHVNMITEPRKTLIWCSCCQSNGFWGSSRTLYALINDSDRLCSAVLREKGVCSRRHPFPLKSQTKCIQNQVLFMQTCPCQCYCGGLKCRLSHITDMQADWTKEPIRRWHVCCHDDPSTLPAQEGDLKVILAGTVCIVLQKQCSHTSCQNQNRSLSPGYHDALTWGFCSSRWEFIMRNWLNWIKFEKDLPIASIWKLKVSSADSFLLDFNLPCRFTILIHPGIEQSRTHNVNQINGVSPQTDMLTGGGEERNSRSRHTRMVSLSSWVTWITHVCGISAAGKDLR